MKIFEFENNALIKAIEDEDLKSRTKKSIEAILKGAQAIWGCIRYPAMVDHGETHTRNVFDLLTRLLVHSLSHLLDNKSDIKLSDAELFCLNIATWLHDIGGRGGSISDKEFCLPMEARKEHPFIGGRIILEGEMPFLNLENDEKLVIADIVIAHSKRVKIEELPEKKMLSSHEGVIRPRLLAILLSLADGCDIQIRRVESSDSVRSRLNEIKSYKEELEKRKENISEIKEKTKLEEEIKYLEAQPEHYKKHLSVQNIFFTPNEIILEPRSLLLPEYKKRFENAVKDVNEEIERVKGYFINYDITLQKARALDEKKDNIEILSKQLEKEGGEKKIPPTEYGESYLYEITSLDEFYNFISLKKYINFLERPLRSDESWKEEKERLVIDEKLINEASDKLSTHKILLITGPPNIGKSTFLLFFIDKCLERNSYKLILFLNPFIEAEVLVGDNGLLNEIVRLIEKKYRGYEKSKVLLAIDALHREESDENYIEKCDKLFEWAFNHGYSLIATIRSDQKDLLKKNFEVMRINKWVKYKLNDGEIEVKPFSSEQIKEALTGLLNYSPYEKIKPEFSFDSKKFNKCVEIIARKSRGVIGEVVFIIEDIYNSNQRFSKETIEQYPEGVSTIPFGYILRWNTIRRDYYIKGDKVLPAVLLFLTYQNYPITKQFVDKFFRWGINGGINELDESLLDGKQISIKVENLLNFYCIPTKFENVDVFSLRSDWREAIEKGSLIENLNLPAFEFVEIVNSGNLVNWLVRFIFMLQKDLENGKLSYSDIKTWHIVGDMAKAWGINIKGLEIKAKLEILKNANNFLTNTIRFHPDIWHFGIPWDFLKKNFSLIWRKVLAVNDVTHQYYDAAIEFYKEVNSQNPEDFLSFWMLGEFCERKGEYDEALELYVESANIQNTSKGYGSLIDKLRPRHILPELPDHVQFEYLELREKAAIKAIECYAGNPRNWRDLAEALFYKGEFVKEEKFGKAVKNYDSAIKAYKRGIEVIEKLTPQRKEDKVRYQKRIAVVLGNRAYVNNRIGRLEESIEDIIKAIEIKRLPCVKEDTEKDKKWCSTYNKRLNDRKFVMQPLNFILDTAKSAIDIKEEEIQKLSNAWYKIKKSLDNLDQKYAGGDLKDLKISALHHSLQLISANKDAEQELKALVGDDFREIEENRYTAKYHEDCAKSIKDQDQKQILEIFHRAFSALIHTMRFTYHLRKDDIKDVKKERNTLSYRWGMLGRRISDDFISMISPKISVRCFKFSVSFRFDNLDSWHNLGWEYLYDGRVDEALKAFDRNLELEKEKGRKKYSHLSKIGIGKIYEGKGDAMSAAKWFKEGVELSTELYAKSDPKKAINLLMKTGESLKNLTSLTIPEDEKIEIIKAALGVTDTALKISESAELTDFKTLLLNKKKWLEKRIRWIKEKKMLPAMSLDEILEAPLVTLLSNKSEPERIETLYDKEFALFKLGEHEKSVEYADKILGLKPSNVFTWINKAQSLYKLRELQKAIECYDESLKLDPNYVHVWYHKGCILNELQRYEEALGCFDKALKLDSKYVPAWLNKIYASLRLSFKKGFKKGFLAESAFIAENALSNVSNKTNFIKKINKLTIPWIKNSIREGFIDSKEKLQFLLDEFKESFGEFGVKTPSLEEIKEKYVENEIKEKINRMAHI